MNSFQKFLLDRLPRASLYVGSWSSAAHNSSKTETDMLPAPVEPRVLSGHFSFQRRPPRPGKRRWPSLHTEGNGRPWGRMKASSQLGQAPPWPSAGTFPVHASRSPHPSCPSHLLPSSANMTFGLGEEACLSVLLTRIPSARIRAHYMVDVQ